MPTFVKSSENLSRPLLRFWTTRIRECPNVNCPASFPLPFFLQLDFSQEKNLRSWLWGGGGKKLRCGTGEKCFVVLQIERVDQRLVRPKLQQRAICYGSRE